MTLPPRGRAAPGSPPGHHATSGAAGQPQVDRLTMTRCLQLSRASVTSARACEFVRFATEDPVRYLLMFQRAVPGFVSSEESMGAQHNSNEPLASRWTALTDRMVRTLLLVVDARPSPDCAPNPASR